MENTVKNTRILWGLVPLMVLTMILGACAETATQTTNPPPQTTENTTQNTGVNPAMPRLENNTKTVQLELSYDEIIAQKNITRNITVEMPGSIVVILASIPPTCAAAPKAAVGNGAMLSEYSHQYVEPTSGMSGTPGKDVWTFKTLQAGVSAIIIDYSPGGQVAWCVTLNVTVK